MLTGPSLQNEDSSSVSQYYWKNNSLAGFTVKPLSRRLSFHRCLFVCLFDVSRITQELLLKRFSQNLVER